MSDNSPRALRSYLFGTAREATNFLRELARDGDESARNELRRRGLPAPPLSLKGLQRLSADTPSLDELRDRERDRDLRKPKHRG